MAAAPAGATQFGGAADYPADGALPGGRDIVRAEARYDDASGALLLVTTFRAAPTQADVLAGAFGVRGADGACNFPGVVFAGATGIAFNTQWSRYDAGGSVVARGSGARQADGTTVLYALASGGFAGQGYNCIASLQVSDGSSSAVVKRVDGFALTPVATPQPQPDPAPTAPAPAPGPTTTTTNPPPPTPARRAVVRKVARLSAGVVGTATRVVAKGRWTTLKLRVVNGGTADAKRTTVTVSGTRGVTVKVAGAPRKRPGTRALKTLKAGKASTLTVKVRATRAGSVRFRAAAAGRLSASGQVALKLKRAPTPSPRRGTAPRPRPALTGPLAGRYFWGTEIDPMYAWDNHAVWFVDDRWAYYGFPPAGRPKCTGPTTVTDDKGRATDEGCRPYTYDARSGRLTVGSLAGTFRAKDGDVTLGELDFNWELTIPSAGARYEADLEHRGFSGMCGLIMGCTTWHYLFALRADGRFMRSNSTTTTMGDGTSTPFVWGSSMPPDKTGTYEILAGGAIRFRYLDGRVATETIGIERSRGKPDAAGRGIVIGDTNYYPDDDD
ncbi:hypothetical protein Q5424_02825 [Conexibacter sp. JD483]|uniref:hypothetical protein n=1 Tax=unclassified Conexibacter TaxID=2627773 RepID=UPI0027192639|nr:MULTISPECIES: hypothetical protein [unclassified Conexibacter]MDO8185039.1 hypothetical protein [Conexibacter sp. CPCC 205706]MDO8196749.1 hypothetical protein [Conexibacter sp. CPCC 205762]MDR9367997.1 hypothetical protein [Conexibacter sp. JD483]